MEIASKCEGQDMDKWNRQNGSQNIQNMMTNKTKYIKLECAVDGPSLQIPTSKFLTHPAPQSSTPGSCPRGGTLGRQGDQFF